MEAVALHDFDATNSAELSFCRNDILKVINNVDDKNWYVAQLGAKRGYVPCNFIKLKDANWYYGTISRAHAELLLKEQAVGAFLVRTSTGSHSEFSISLKGPPNSDHTTLFDVQHFRVCQEPTGRFYVWNVKFDSLNEMIEYYRSVSISQSQEILLIDIDTRFNVQALFDFVPEEAGELEFRRGDIITVLSREDKYWWTGQIDGRKGLFPANYVKKVST